MPEGIMDTSKNSYKWILKPAMSGHCYCCKYYLGGMKCEIAQGDQTCNDILACKRFEKRNEEED